MPFTLVVANAAVFITVNFCLGKVRANQLNSNAEQRPRFTSSHKFGGTTKAIGCLDN
jgi:hypothetical protein